MLRAGHGTPRDLAKWWLHALQYADDLLLGGLGYKMGVCAKLEIISESVLHIPNLIWLPTLVYLAVSKIDLWPSSPRALVLKYSHVLRLPCQISHRYGIYLSDCDNLCEIFPTGQAPHTDTTLHREQRCWRSFWPIIMST